MSQTVTPTDIRIRGVWTDIYTSSGISQGSSLYIQNKSSTPISIIESPDVPDENSESGILLRPYEVATVVEGSVGCWVLGSGVISVQNSAN